MQSAKRHLSAEAPVELRRVTRNLIVAILKGRSEFPTREALVAWVAARRAASSGLYDMAGTCGSGPALGS